MESNRNSCLSSQSERTEKRDEIQACVHITPTQYDAFFF